MKNKLYIFCLLFINVLFVNAQKKKELVQLSGIIKNEYLQPLPYAHIFILNSSRGTITDQFGKFTIVTRTHDTVMFTSLGYKSKKLIISDTLKEPFLNIQVILETDTIMIKEVVVYPWKNYEQFKEAFLNLKLPEDDIERARKNIALLRTQIILDNNPSAIGNYRYVMNQQIEATYNKWSYPSYQIFNPFAWAKFFEALKRGDFSNKKNEK